MEKFLALGLKIGLVMVALSLFGVMNTTSNAAARRPPPANSLFGVSVGTATLARTAFKSEAAGAANYFLAGAVELAYCLGLVVLLGSRGYLEDSTDAKVMGGAAGALLSLLSWPLMSLWGVSLSGLAAVLGIVFGGLHAAVVAWAASYFHTRPTYG